MDFELFDVD